jgi:hypothetical protein
MNRCTFTGHRWSDWQDVETLAEGSALLAAIADGGLIAITKQEKRTVQFAEKKVSMTPLDQKIARLQALEKARSDELSAMFLDNAAKATGPITYFLPFFAVAAVAVALHVLI